MVAQLWDIYHVFLVLTDIIGYDRLKFCKIQTPKMKSSVRHWPHSSDRINDLYTYTFAGLLLGSQIGVYKLTKIIYPRSTFTRPFSNFR